MLSLALEATIESLETFPRLNTPSPITHKLTSMHDRNHEPGHIPPPDLPQHRTYFGFRPHIFIGGLVLIAILFLYLILFVNGRPIVRHPQPAAPATTPSTSR